MSTRKLPASIAYTFIKKNLTFGNIYTSKDIENVLHSNYPVINDNQVSGIINDFLKHDALEVKYHNNGKNYYLFKNTNFYSQDKYKKKINYDSNLNPII